MPDTLFIQEGRLTHWLFMSQSGHIKKKNTDRLSDNKIIYDAFTSGSSRRGTVALHIMPNNTATGAAVTPMDAAGLKDFLEVKRWCKLDPGLNARLVSKVQPNGKRNLLFNFNLIYELAPLHPGQIQAGR